MSIKRALTGTSLAAVLLLAACNSNSDSINAIDAGKLVYGSIKAIGKERVAPSEEVIGQLGTLALQETSPDDPLASFRLKSIGAASVLRRIETNRRHSTWTAWGVVDRKTVVTKDGMIAATRGLGQDLMSANVDRVLELVTQREEGTVQYEQRYLDGSFQIIEAKSTCEVTRGYEKTVVLESGPVPVLQMFSSCFSAKRQFVDQFLVDNGGRILEMRQWVGPTLGFAHMKQLR